MKRNVISGLLFLLVLASVHAAVQPNVIVKSFSTDTEVAVGKDFNLLVTLGNTEPASCAEATTTMLQANAPFIMRGVSTQSAGEICSNETVTLSFPLRIDPTATGGFYQITLLNTYETSLLAQYSNTNVINIFVNASPQIDAHIVTSTPVDVYPGDTATITVDIQNNGAYPAQSLTAHLTADAPLEVNALNSFASLGTLDARQGRQAQFTVDVPKNAASQDYPMSLQVQYLDMNAAQVTRDIPITFSVKKKAQFSTSDAGSDGLYANENGRTVRLNLKNTGTDVAYKIKASIQPQFPFSTDGSVRYIDELDPGQSAPVDFVINVDKDATVGTYGLDMNLNFEDAKGKQLSDTAKVALVVPHKGILRAVFIDYWFLWLVAIIVAVIVWRKKSKKEKK